MQSLALLESPPPLSPDSFRRGHRLAQVSRIEMEGQPTRSQEQALLKPLALLECQPTRSQNQALLQPLALLEWQPKLMQPPPR